MSYDQDIFDYMNQSKEIIARDPFVPEGSHDTVIVEVSPFNHQTHGPSVKVIVHIAESNRPEWKGKNVVKIYNLTRPAKFPTQPTDKDRFADFLRKVTARAHGQEIASIARAVTRDRVGDQMLRGARVRAVGRVTNAAKVGQTGTNGKVVEPYVDVEWQSVEQTPEQVKAAREWLDREHPYSAPQAAPAAPPPYGAQPPQGYGQAPAAPSQPQGYGQFLAGGAPAQAPVAPPPAATGAPKLPW